MKTATTFFIVSIILTSCYTIKTISINNIMDKYKDKSEHEILLEFGSPTKTSSDGAGGKILNYTISQLNTNYEINRQNHPYNTISPYGFVGSSTTYSTSDYIEFYINSSDKVYYYRTNYPDGKEKILDKPRTQNAIIRTSVFAIVIAAIIAVSAK